MGKLAVAILLGISAFLGVRDMPAQTDPDWSVVQPWQETSGSLGNSYVFKAVSRGIIDRCRANPHHYVNFPYVIHASQAVFLDGVVVSNYGDESFRVARSFYGAPVLACRHLIGGGELQWRVDSYTRYFSRLYAFPQVSSQRSYLNFFHETLNIIAAGSMLVLSGFCLVIFYRKVSLQLCLSVVFACFFFGLYFFATVTEFFNSGISMMTAHKLSDSSVWVGAVFLMNALRLEGHFGKTLFSVYCASVFFSAVIVLGGQSGDVIQFGTTIPFGFTMWIVTVALIKAVRRIVRKEGSFRLNLLQALSLGLFALSCYSDIFVLTGLSSGYMILSIGVVSGLMFLALSVNEQIIAAYDERDYLRTHLEEEVARKTEALESAMASLKSAQSELIQSAKLASLGTLSAGIAHQINNSLNFVNGSLKPLEKVVMNMEGADKGKASKLFEAMHAGLKLTFETIDSLRRFTGLNQAKTQQVSIADVVDDVLTILKQRLSGIEVELNIDPACRVSVEIVMLNQAIMNVVGNALDAMEKGGRLSISCSIQGNDVMLIIADTGCGMSDRVRDKIFDPFFTTKEVGKGQGIGMYIVQTMIQNHGGGIRVESEEGKGSTVYMTLPLEAEKTTAEQAS